MTAERPSASLIVPFAGSDEELAALESRLARVATRERDEVIVVDNRAQSLASAYHARNDGARRARGDWLVFVDADTTPAPDLLDAYLDPAPARDVGVLAGAIEDIAEEPTLVSRYVTSRSKMDQSVTLSHPRGPYAQTANCAVRREAFEAVGGFEDAIRSGGDADLCWRLVDAGWRLQARPAAIVSHRSRERVRDLLGQIARHGSGMAWLEERYPGSFPPPRPTELPGRVAHYLRSAVRARDRERAAFALLDLATLFARDIGRRRSNAAPIRSTRP